MGLFSESNTENDENKDRRSQTGRTTHVTINEDHDTRPSQTPLGRPTEMTVRSSMKGRAKRVTVNEDQDARPSQTPLGRPTEATTNVGSLPPVRISTMAKKSVYKPPAKITKKESAITEKKNTNTIHINKLLRQNTQDLMSTLTPEVRLAFETLFDRIDVSDSGGLTAKEIQKCISKHANANLTLEQVQKVLTSLDLKGTGDIEFDEFIFMLSQPENYIRLLDSSDIAELKKDNKTTKRTQLLMQKHISAVSRKSKSIITPTEIFFRALRNATKHDSMTALRTFYRNKLKKLNDHVIHDWSAGQRCIGLSDQEMLKRYETIQGELLRQRVNFCKDNSYKQSPYARPLEWGVLTLRQAIENRKFKMGEAHQEAKVPERRVKMSEFVVTPKAVPLPKYAIKRRSPLKRAFNYDQLADIRDKVDDIANVYYSELKNVARDNSIIVKKELAVDDIKAEASRKNFNLTFKAYCTPFVVSPWIPMPSPTLQASFTPLGRSKLACQRIY